MKSIVAVLCVGTAGFFATAFDPALEMWAPLIVWTVPLLVYMMWPVRDRTGGAVRPAPAKAA